jgi:hypothetical protein
MAATKTHSGDINARTQDKIRSKIKVFEIVKALSDHILAGLKMTNTQVRAAEILLRKVSPDLLATAISDSRETGLPLLQIVRSPPPDAAVSPLAGATDQPHSKVSDQSEPAAAQDQAGVDSAA